MTWERCLLYRVLGYHSEYLRTPHKSDCGESRESKAGRDLGGSPAQPPAHSKVSSEVRLLRASFSWGLKPQRIQAAQPLWATYATA